MKINSNEPKTVKDLSKQVNEDLIFETPVKGHSFSNEYSLKGFIECYRNSGFQASNLVNAIDEIVRMKENKAKIFFGCTSNMITSGLRDTICALAKAKKFDVFVTTGGGIEEDLIKCIRATNMASFDIKGHLLREGGYNRVGNLVISNENYMIFEQWLTAALDDLTKLCTIENPIILTPSSFIKFLGKRISEPFNGKYFDYENSVLYWCYKNEINVYSPAVIDGSIGDILTFYENRNCIKLDIVEDIRNINFETVYENKTGVIILGAGLVKHHILNANLFRNGAEYCVIINNASEFDGSDAGATIEEAISWGKVKSSHSGVKVFGDATILFPLIAAAAFF